MNMYETGKINYSEAASTDVWENIKDWVHNELFHISLGTDAETLERHPW